MFYFLEIYHSKQHIINTISVQNHRFFFVNILVLYLYSLACHPTWPQFALTTFAILMSITCFLCSSVRHLAYAPHHELRRGQGARQGERAHAPAPRLAESAPAAAPAVLQRRLLRLQHVPLDLHERSVLHLLPIHIRLFRVVHKIRSIFSQYCIMYSY